MGIPSNMNRLVVLSLFVFIAGIQGASLPYHGEYEWHFDKMGVHLDLVLKDEVNPLVGGKAHVELPVSTVWKFLEVDQPLLRPIIIALEKSAFGRIYDVMTVKADLTFNAEKVLEGFFNVAADLTLVRRDGTEEKATLLIQGKNESGKLITSVELIPKNPRPQEKIFVPVKMIFTCNWPNVHTFTINSELGTIIVSIANDMNEVSVRGVWEFLGLQHKWSTLISIKEKYIKVTFEEPTKDPHNILLEFKMLNGFPRIEVTGSLPTTRWFKAGVFKTDVIITSWYNFEVKHIFNGMEMFKLKVAVIDGKIEVIAMYGLAHKTQIVLEYEYMKWVKIIMPTTTTWLTEELGIEMHYQPTNEAKFLEGGNIKIVAMLDNKPIVKMGGYYGLTLDSTKYEILLKDFYVNMMEPIMGLNFSELKFFGKVFVDRIHKNLLPKVSLEAKIEKDEMKVFHYILTTIETPYKFHIFFPYLFQNLLNMTQEFIEITHEHVVVGNKWTITTLCNLTTKKLVATITPTMMSYELFDGEVSLVKYVSELTKVDVGPNSLLLEGNKIIQFNAYHPCIFPEVFCFNQLMTKFHIQVVDKAKGKVNLNVAVTKDTTEMFNAVVNNVQTPHIIVLKVPILPLEIRIDYEVSTKVLNIMINNKSYVMVKPTVADEVEVVAGGTALLKVALLPTGFEITTLMKKISTITIGLNWKTLALKQNTIDLDITVGKFSHKTLIGWDIETMKKGFVDIKLIGSGMDLLGDYEVDRRMSWSILSLKNIDVEWTGKVLCTGLKLFKTPLETEGKILFTNYVLDLEMVEKIVDVPYTLIFKTKPLTVALIPFFHYP